MCLVDLHYNYSYLSARFIFTTGTRTECYAAQAEREKRMQMAGSDTKGISIHLRAVVYRRYGVEGYTEVWVGNYQVPNTRMVVPFYMHVYIQMLSKI